MYAVNYTSSAKKDLMKLPSDVQERIRGSSLFCMGNLI